MRSPASATAHRLSYIIAVLAFFASAGGLFFPGLYRDNSFVRAAWWGNDLVTLLVALPVLLASLAYARRGAAKAILIWLATLDYTLYNYAFYLFGAHFNVFFLLYAALVALSLFALLFGLVGLDVRAISGRFRNRTPVRAISGYMIVVALGLSAVYVTQCIQFIGRGIVPPVVRSTGHPTSIIFALDLTLLVPALVLGAVWLWHHRPWGYVLASILVVKGTLYTLVLTVSSLAAANAGILYAAAETPLWIMLTFAGLVASGMLLVNMKEREQAESRKHDPHSRLTEPG